MPQGQCFVAAVLESLERDSSWLTRATYTLDRSTAEDLGAQSAPAIDADRRRLLSALVEPFVTDGYRATSVERICRASGIDLRLFNHLFTSTEDCFLQAYDELLGEVGRLLAASLPSEGTWPERLAAGLTRALELIDESPTSARLVLVEAQRATPTIAAHHLATIEQLVPFMREGRVFSASYIPPLLDSTLLFGVAYTLGLQLTEHPRQPVAGLRPELLRLLLLPYLGDKRTADFIANRARLEHRRHA